MKLIFSLIVFSIFSSLAFPQKVEAGQLFYLIRHAEKKSDGTSDPVLSDIGKKRALWLSKYFFHKKLTAVYSTSFNRTRDTVAPTAYKKGLEVTEYNPRDLSKFVSTLKKQNGPVLIVGHSNTTPDLAGILSGQKAEKITEGQYDRIYIVHIDDDGKSYLKMTYSDSDNH